MPEENHYVAFVLKDGRAHKVEVECGVKNGQEAEVLGEKLHDCDTVAIQDNSELEDRMAVTIGGMS